MVPRIECIWNLTHFIDIGEHFFQKLKAQIAVSAQLVSKRPNDAVKDGIKVVLGKLKKRAEIKFD